MLDLAAILDRSQRDHFWIPAGTLVQERKGLSYLSSPEDLPHLNAVIQTEPSECDLDAAVSEVSTAHRAVHRAGRCIHGSMANPCAGRSIRVDIVRMPSSMPEQ